MQWLKDEGKPVDLFQTRVPPHHLGALLPVWWVSCEPKAGKFPAVRLRSLWLDSLPHVPNLATEFTLALQT